MSEQIRHIIGAVIMAWGIVSIAVGLFGVLRFHYVLNRMHCAALIDTFGIGSIFLGLIIWTWDMAYIPRLLVLWLVLWISSPIASHFVAETEILTGNDLEEHMEKEDARHGNI